MIYKARSLKFSLCITNVWIPHQLSIEVLTFVNTWGILWLLCMHDILPLFILLCSIITMIIFSKSWCFNGYPLVSEFIWELSRFIACYRFVATRHEWVNVKSIQPTLVIACHGHCKPWNCKQQTIILQCRNKFYWHLLCKWRMKS